VEHLAALRAIPHLSVIRPGDANEVLEAWLQAVQFQGPTAIILSRQSVPTLDRTLLAGADGLARGAYILADLGGGTPDVILMATGSELELIVDAGRSLTAEGIRVRLVSFPSWDLFEKQDAAYKEMVLPRRITARLAVEAGVGQGWEKYTGSEGQMITLTRFGAAAPYKKIFEELGFTSANVAAVARKMIGRE
jgi:transketolase